MKSTTVQATIETHYYCESCEKLYDPDDIRDAGPLYECGNCGTVFNRSSSANDNHQCPDCNKFGAKTADASCPEGCEDELEERSVLVYQGTVYVEQVDE